MAYDLNKTALGWVGLSFRHRVRIVVKTDFCARGVGAPESSLRQSAQKLCARKTSFRQISCTGGVRTKHVVKIEFVHRDCVHEKHHPERFYAPGLCTLQAPLRQILCTGAVRTKNAITADLVHRAVRAKNIIKTNFVHRIVRTKNAMMAN